MDEQEQPQNEVPAEGEARHGRQEEQNVQMEPTPVSSPPSHKKLIIGIVVGFVLAVVGMAGVYFFIISNNNVELKTEQQNQSADDINKNLTENISSDVSKYILEVREPSEDKILIYGQPINIEWEEQSFPISIYLISKECSETNCFTSKPTVRNWPNVFTVVEYLSDVGNIEWNRIGVLENGLNNILPGQYKFVFAKSSEATQKIIGESSYFYIVAQENSNPQEFSKINNYYYKDNLAVYFFSVYSLIGSSPTYNLNKIEEIDVISVNQFSATDVYLITDDVIYVSWTNLSESFTQPLLDVDTPTFELLSDYYAKDKNRVYYREKVISGVSPEDFAVQIELFEDFLGREKYLAFGVFENKVYYGAILLEEIDASEMIVEEGIMYDSDTLWYETGSCFWPNIEKGSLELKDTYENCQ